MDAYRHRALDSRFDDRRRGISVVGCAYQKQKGIIVWHG
jgi:hypothetical protein